MTSAPTTTTLTDILNLIEESADVALLDGARALLDSLTLPQTVATISELLDWWDRFFEFDSVDPYAMAMRKINEDSTIVNPLLKFRGDCTLHLSLYASIFHDAASKCRFCGARGLGLLQGI